MSNFCHCSNGRCGHSSPRSDINWGAVGGGFPSSSRLFSAPVPTPAPTPLPSPSYPVRGANNSSYIRTRFPGHRNGEALRAHLSYVLVTDWWWNNAPAPRNALDYFVFRGRGSMGCHFCGKEYPNGHSALICVCKHLDYRLH